MIDWRKPASRSEASRALSLSWSMSLTLPGRFITVPKTSAELPHRSLLTSEPLQVVGQLVARRVADDPRRDQRHVPAQADFRHGERLHVNRRARLLARVLFSSGSRMIRSAVTSPPTWTPGEPARTAGSTRRSTAILEPPGRITEFTRSRSCRLTFSLRAAGETGGNDPVGLVGGDQRLGGAARPPRIPDPTPPGRFGATPSRPRRRVSRGPRTVTTSESRSSNPPASIPRANTTPNICLPPLGLGVVPLGLLDGGSHRIASGLDNGLVDLFLGQVAQPQANEMPQHHRGTKPIRRTAKGPFSEHREDSSRPRGRPPARIRNAPGSRGNADHRQKRSLPHSVSASKSAKRA